MFIYFEILSHVDLISFVLSIFSIILGYWFWKHPISTQFQNELPIYDGDNIKYIVGHDNYGWKIKRVNDTDSDSDINIVSWASLKNNPNIKVPPKTLSEIDLLYFD